MSYTATCTATTPVSLTNHSYFNLSAGSDSTVFNHMLQLACDAYAPDDGSGDGLPTGRFVSVEGTSRDLRGGRPLSEVITDQARLSPHWPHGEEFVVAANRGLNSNAVAVACEHKLPPFAAQLWHPPSGRCVRVYTSEPALQTYYGTLLSNTGHVMKNGHSYGACAGVCLETQRHANAEATGAPSRLLRKGEVYRQETVLVFSAQ
jgi:aldose 1-epimerase